MEMLIETKKLEQLSARLNKESDSLTETLQNIQDKINSYNIGLEVWTSPLLCSYKDEYGPENATFDTYLGYAKLPNGWGLAIRVVHDKNGKTGPYDIDDCPEPLLNASRKIRMQALRLLTGLILEIQSKIEEVLSGITDAKKISEKL